MDFGIKLLKNLAITRKKMQKNKRKIIKKLQNGLKKAKKNGQKSNKKHQKRVSLKQLIKKRKYKLIK